jgi:hypothetical protein
MAPPNISHLFCAGQVLFLPVMSHALEEGGDDGSQVVDAALVEAVATDMLGLGQISTSQPGDGREEGPSSNDTTAHLVGGWRGSANMCTVCKQET